MSESAQRPPATRGMHHLALTVTNLDQCQHFYQELLGMALEWQPDPDNIYLCSGNDNLALHRASEGFSPDSDQRLDHLGFILAEIAHVDRWHDFLQDAGVEILTKPRTHRDGARSFYCLDPDGNRVQLIYHPPISDKL